MSSENESGSPPLGIEKCSLVLVDVAGTTTSINFVKDTLFPFVVSQAETYLQARWEEDAVKECIGLLKEENDLDVKAAAEKVKKLTEEDSDNKGLKTLQGLIYKDGYDKGELKAHIFDDVAEAFESWAKSRHIAIYSTGSVDSQKLLFSNTSKGDISTHIHKYFDQSVGPKTEAESYKKIAEDVKISTEEVVFITDDPKEATAAKAGGVTAVLITREGNSPLSEEIIKEFTVISSFKDLGLEKAAKRKIEGEPPVEEAPPSKVAKTNIETVEEEPKPTEEKPEAMEVDTEKSTETVEQTTATEETEKPTETEPEKTEIKDTEMKEVEEKVEEPVAEEKKEEAEKTEPVAEKKETVVEEKETTTETSPKDKTETKEEAKPEEKEAKLEETTVVAEPSAEETKVADEKKDTAETAKEEAKPAEKETKKTVAEEAKPVEEKEVAKSAEEKTEVVKPAEKTEVTKPAEEKETDVAKPTEKTEVPKPAEKTEVTKPAEEKAAEVAKPETVKPAEETEVAKPAEQAEVAKPVEEEKPEEKTEPAEEKPVSNGEGAESSSTKTEEKENKSVLANGVENGKDASEVDVDDHAGESAEVKNDDDKNDETEVKVKKIEESAESKTVSVEV